MPQASLAIGRVLLLVAIVLLGRTAGAQDAAPPASRAASEPERYAWQILLADGAGVLAGVAVASTVDVRADRLGVMAATWYGVGAVAAPAVHHAHGNWPIGLSDFGMRVLIPPVVGFFGLVAGCTANREFEGSCARPGWAAGSLIGLGGVALLDAFVLADESMRLEPPQGEWYGWQVLLIDAIGYGLGISFAASDPETKDGDEIHPALAMWVLGYTVGVIGAPIVHFTHGRVGAGFGAFGLRLLLAPVGALPGLIGYCAATSGSSDCAEIGAIWGLLGGSLAVSLFDAFVLGRDPDATASATTAGVSIGPGSVTVRGYW